MEYSDLSRPQLLDLLRRYDAALDAIVEKFADESALHAYRSSSPAPPDEFEKGRLNAYKQTARIAAAALNGCSVYAPRLLEAYSAPAR